MLSFNIIIPPMPHISGLLEAWLLYCPCQNSLSCSLKMKVLGLEINWVQISEARVGYYALKIFQNLFLKWVLYANSTKFIRCDRVVFERSVSLSPLNHPAAVCTGLGPGGHLCVPFISNHLLRWFYALKIHQCTVCRWRACKQLVC